MYVWYVAVQEWASYSVECISHSSSAFVFRRQKLSFEYWWLHSGRPEARKEGRRRRRCSKEGGGGGAGGIKTAFNYLSLFLREGIFPSFFTLNPNMGNHKTKYIIYLSIYSTWSADFLVMVAHSMSVAFRPCLLAYSSLSERGCYGGGGGRGGRNRTGKSFWLERKERGRRKEGRKDEEKWNMLFAAWIFLPLPFWAEREKQKNFLKTNFLALLLKLTLARKITANSSFGYNIREQYIAWYD